MDRAVLEHLIPWWSVCAGPRGGKAVFLPVGQQPPSQRRLLRVPPTHPGVKEDSPGSGTEVIARDSNCRCCCCCAVGPKHGCPSPHLSPSLCVPSGGAPAVIRGSRKEGLGRAEGGQSRATAGRLGLALREREHRSPSPCPSHLAPPGLAADARGPDPAADQHPFPLREMAVRAFIKLPAVPSDGM